MKCGDMMKRLTLVILIIICLVFSSCSSVNKQIDNTNDGSEKITSSVTEKDTSSQDDILIAGNDLTTSERSDETTEKETVSTVQKTTQTDTKDKTDNKKPQDIAESPSEEQKTTSQETVSTTEKPKEEPDTEKPTENNSTVNSEPVIPKATAEDTEKIAEKLVEYINAYRAEQGVSAAVVLPGLTKYAEYRSRQLVSNFAHDTADERAAATALEYGKYIDPMVYGATGSPYYTANAREAIVKAGYSGSIDNVAKNIAQLTRNSSGHWEYVGGAKYSYIAIGITYDSGYWYCDIAMTRENTDN